MNGLEEVWSSCGFFLFKWQRSHSVFSCVLSIVGVFQCVCWDTCMEAGGGWRLLICHSRPYSLEAGSLMEPGARLAAQRTQWPSYPHPTAHMWPHLAFFPGISPSVCWDLNTYLHDCKSSCSLSHFFSPNIKKKKYKSTYKLKLSKVRTGAWELLNGWVWL